VQSGTYKVRINVLAPRWLFEGSDNLFPTLQVMSAARDDLKLLPPSTDSVACKPSSLRPRIDKFTNNVIVFGDTVSQEAKMHANAKVHAKVHDDTLSWHTRVVSSRSINFTITTTLRHHHHHHDHHDHHHSHLCQASPASSSNTLFIGWCILVIDAQFVAIPPVPGYS